MVGGKLFVALLVVAAANGMERPFYETNAKLTATGHRIWGGDMVLNDDQLAAVMGGFSLRTARKDLRSRWPNGHIPFKISPELEVARKNIYKALKIWNDGTCLAFYEDANISPDVPHLILQKTGTGCNSWVGIFNTTSTEQIVSLDDGCHEHVSVILHELGHALGLWHEQDRPDRDSYLTIHTNNMDPKNRVYFNNPMSDVDTYGLPYDYSSIMQYSPNAFSANGRMTLVPKDPLAVVIMDRAKKPSFRDFKLVNLMYECPSYCPQTTCSNGGYVAWNFDKGCRCMCAPGFGGSTCNKRVPAESPCTYTITNPTTITSPNYPDSMPADKHCAWLIKLFFLGSWSSDVKNDVEVQFIDPKNVTYWPLSAVAPSNKRIQVKFNTFDMLGRYEKNNKCVWDSLRFRKSDLQSDDPGTEYCGDELENESLVSQKEMLLILETYSDYSTGFEASVSFV